MEKPHSLVDLLALAELPAVVAKLQARVAELEALARRTPDDELSPRRRSCWP
jgi:hypothetical protein